MKRSIFTPSMRFLIIALIILAIVVPKEYSKLGMTLLLLAWLAFTIVQSFWGHREHWNDKLKLILNKISAKTGNHRTTSGPDSRPPEPVVEPENPSTDPNRFSNEELNSILVHISLRITEKLKSGYQDATWEWATSPSLHEILSGTASRISVSNMTKYTHADISFDRFGRIHIEPMTIGRFDPDDNSNDDDGNTNPSEPTGFDVKAWYDLIGHSVLERVITELNTKGHTMLTIEKNGNIVIRQNKKSAFIASLDNFPAPNHWNELTAILEENELTAKITNNTIRVSWN